MDAAGLLAAYQGTRGRVPDPLPEGARAERDGPLVRIAGLPRGGFVEYRYLGGLDGDELDELIARQVRVFAERGESFEWKLHGHDLPRDLPDHLRAAGLVPDEEETVLAAPVSAIAREPELPEGVVLREVSAEADFRRIAELENAVWGDGEDWLAATLAGWRRVDPESLTVVVAEAGGEMVSAAWLRFRGQPFARLNGGATLPDWRGRGVYRALVAHRANVAAGRGYDYLHVDASAASRPILERLGFVAITTTTPFIWSPPG